MTTPEEVLREALESVYEGGDPIDAYHKGRAALDQLLQERDDIRAGWQKQTADWADKRSEWQARIRELEAERDANQRDHEDCEESLKDDIARLRADLAALVKEASEAMWWMERANEPDDENQTKEQYRLMIVDRLTAALSHQGEPTDPTCPDCGRTSLEPALNGTASCLAFHSGDYLPDSCPTCGSDAPSLRRVGAFFTHSSQVVRCSDPWHSGEPTEGEQG